MPKKKWYYSNIILTPDEQELVEKHKNMIYYVWSKLEDYWLKMSYREELISAGLEGLCIAAKTYNPEKGEFSPHSYMWIYTKMVREIKQLNKLNDNLISIDEPILDGKTSEKVYIKDILIDETENVEERSINKDMAERIWKEAFKVCDQREIRVLYLYCYKFMSLTDIGKDMGVSRERARQIFNKARKKIFEKIEINT